MVMLMGFLSKLFWGFENLCVAQTVRAVGQQWVANSVRLRPQDGHKTKYAMRLLKHVLSKSEGPQKWLAPCSTDVHRVARTIDVWILEKESHRQSTMIM
jgi:hypothetical protein